MFCIDHDLHLHSSLSKCCHDPAMTPEKILAWAEKQGYRMATCPEPRRGTLPRIFLI